ncbi:virulence factor TspB C-terminal domain-related protein [Cupriavidus plantarum]|uniref:virulence factor TspB C-terminal domain-related protein n=1 Tax=Cupriavidus plantarum TaxID=942865 RepID=UPI0015CBB56D|nr:virulence factor TspB C-terminal domain-related protein [Cupriavidus plantarum]NYI00233.1 hypothetical protein [Cupriavidus plantarum]
MSRAMRFVMSFVVLLALVPVAHGSTISHPYLPSVGYWNSGGSFVSDSADQSCALQAAYYTSVSGATGNQYTSIGTESANSDNTAMWCLMQRSSKQTGAVIDVVKRSYSVEKRTGCASGDTLTNGTCYPPGTNGPPPPDCTATSTKNAYIGAWVVGSASTAPGYACIQGCQYPQGAFAASGSFGYGMSIGAGNGQTCSGANYTSIDTTTKKDDPPSPVSCGQRGLVYGTLNGVGICAPASDIPNSTVKQDTTTTKTDTSASGVQAPPQTTNTTTTVTNNNGTTTVTQTTTNPDGSKSSTTTDKDTFCSKNPNDNICKSRNSATGGDTCAAAPVCTGDAVQCAMLTQQWRTRCDQQKTDETVAFGQQLATGQDPIASTLPTPAKATQIDLSDRLQNVDDMGITAQCMADVQISLPALPGSGGAGLTISTGPLCDIGKLFGLLNVLGTTVLCAYMLRGAF